MSSKNNFKNYGPILILTIILIMSSGTGISTASSHISPYVIANTDYTNYDVNDTVHAEANSYDLTIGQNYSLDWNLTVSGWLVDAGNFNWTAFGNWSQESINWSNLGMIHIGEFCFNIDLYEVWGNGSQWLDSDNTCFEIEGNQTGGPINYEWIEVDFMNEVLNNSYHHYDNTDDVNINLTMHELWEGGEYYMNYTLSHMNSAGGWIDVYLSPEHFFYGMDEEMGGPVSFYITNGSQLELLLFEHEFDTGCWNIDVRLFNDTHQLITAHWGEMFTIGDNDSCYYFTYPHITNVISDGFTQTDILNYELNNTDVIGTFIEGDIAPENYTLNIWITDENGVSVLDFTNTTSGIFFTPGTGNGINSTGAGLGQGCYEYHADLHEGIIFLDDVSWLFTINMNLTDCYGGFGNETEDPEWFNIWPDGHWPGAQQYDVQAGTPLDIYFEAGNLNSSIVYRIAWSVNNESTGLKVAGGNSTFSIISNSLLDTLKEDLYLSNGCYEIEAELFNDNNGESLDFDNFIFCLSGTSPITTTGYEMIVIWPSGHNYTIDVGTPLEVLYEVDYLASEGQYEVVWTISNTTLPVAWDWGSLQIDPNSSTIGFADYLITNTNNISYLPEDCYQVWAGLYGHDGTELVSDDFEFCVENPLLTDSDGDSVSDIDDQCPGTPAGTAVDSVGCSEQLDHCSECNCDYEGEEAPLACWASQGGQCCNEDNDDGTDGNETGENETGGNETGGNETGENETGGNDGFESEEPSEGQIPGFTAITLSISILMALTFRARSGKHINNINDKENYKSLD